MKTNVPRPRIEYAKARFPPKRRPGLSPRIHAENPPYGSNKPYGYRDLANHGTWTPANGWTYHETMYKTYKFYFCQKSRQCIKVQIQGPDPDANE